MVISPQAKTISSRVTSAHDDFTENFFGALFNLLITHCETEIKYEAIKTRQTVECYITRRLQQDRRTSSHLLQFSKVLQKRISLHCDMLAL